MVLFIMGFPIASPPRNMVGGGGRGLPRTIHNGHLAFAVRRVRMKKKVGKNTRSSPNDDQTARRLRILYSLCVESFGALAKAVRLLRTSLQSQKMSCQTCSTSRIDILVDFQPFGCNLKGGGGFDPHFEGCGRRGSWG